MAPKDEFDKKKPLKNSPNFLSYIWIYKFGNSHLFYSLFCIALMLDKLDSVIVK
ncbi:MAG: hypothetical protein PHZ07_01385 [Patescibacteria group bacterium]|nr:hypothetical protein [Patescibacteria group bacterium]